MDTTDEGREPTKAELRAKFGWRPGDVEITHEGDEPDDEGHRPRPMPTVPREPPRPDG